MNNSALASGPACGRVGGVSESAEPKPHVLVVMGVSGSGKSTIAKALVDELGWDFQEGDELHPKANVEKMAAGHPLTDDDRWPWLERVKRWIDEHLDEGRSGIVTCSALKRAYRDVLRRDGVVFVLLDGSHEVLAERLAHRKNHYMPASLLDSQLADLERPDDDEVSITVDLGGSPEAKAGHIVGELEFTASEV